jgi:hypothetical protein
MPSLDKWKSIVPPVLKVTPGQDILALSSISIGEGQLREEHSRQNRSVMRILDNFALHNFEPRRVTF